MILAMTECPVCVVCDAPPLPPPPSLPPETPPALPVKSVLGARGDDAEVLASVVVNLPALGTALGLYIVLYFMFWELYHANACVGVKSHCPSSAAKAGAALYDTSRACRTMNL